MTPDSYQGGNCGEACSRDSGNLDQVVCTYCVAGPPPLIRTTWNSAPQASSVSERAFVRQTRRSVKIPRDLDHGSERINGEGRQKRNTRRG